MWISKLITIVMIVFGVFEILFLFLLWKHRKDASIIPRNPQILCLTAITCIFCSEIFLSSFAFQVGCYFINIARALISGGVFIPTIARGFQFLIHTNSRVRRKFPKLKSNGYLCFLIILFCVFHYGVTEIGFRFVFDKETCFPNEFMIYIIIINLLVLISTFKIYRMIPWRYDVYLVADDMKACFICWVICACVTLFLAFLGALGGASVARYIPPSEVGFLLILASTFIVTIVKPLSVLELRQKGRLYENPLKVVKCKSNAVHPEILANQELISRLACNLSEQSRVLETIFESEIASQKLKDFANRLFCSETIHFLEAAVAWRKGTPEIQTMKSMIDEFIVSDSVNEINISAEMKAQILRVASATIIPPEDILVDIFEDARKELTEMFFDNILGDFGHPEQFLAIVQEVTAGDTGILADSFNIL